MDDVFMLTRKQLNRSHRIFRCYTASRVGSADDQCDAPQSPRHRSQPA